MQQLEINSIIIINSIRKNDDSGLFPENNITNWMIQNFKSQKRQIDKLEM